MLNSLWLFLMTAPLVGAIIDPHILTGSVVIAIIVILSRSLRDWWRHLRFSAIRKALLRIEKEHAGRHA